MGCMQWRAEIMSIKTIRCLDIVMRSIPAEFDSLLVQLNADVAKWQTRLAQTQLEQSVPVQVRPSVSVDLAQLVQHWSRKPAGEMVRREGSTPSVHALGRHGGTGIHTCPRSKRESMWVRIPLTALRRFGRVTDCGSLENCRPGDLGS